MANQRTKFEVYRFSHSGDILVWTRNLNGLRDHNHAIVRSGFSLVW